MELKEVVAVCGSEALVFGERNEKTGIRPLKFVEVFDTRGQALSFANDREEKAKNRNGK